jgi:CheY-like chemotaxis protein
MSKFVLIVEDDFSIREALKLALELEGYQTHGASNGQEALDFLSRCARLPDAILVDLMMPVLDGFAFIESIKKNELLSKIGIISMSAMADDWKNSEHLHLKKPIELDSLFQSVKTVLDYSPDALLA